MRLYEFDRPRAAGCIIRAADTGRWCLQQRSNSVTDPGVWSTWGGGAKPGESLEQCVRRELEEEGGYAGPLKLEPLLMSSDYATYIGHVPHEFEPRLNSESQDSCWVEAGDWPSPMHPGLIQALTKLENSLNEAPLADYQPLGNFDKPGPFRGADKRLIPHPTNRLKTAKFFEQTPYDFRLFFSNIPGTGRYSEYGPMDPDVVRIIFGDDAEQILDGHENAITVVFVGNKGDSKVMMTPWIMAHRIGHAVQAGTRMGRKGNQSVWKEVEKHFFQGINNLLKDFYGKGSEGQYDYGPRWDLNQEYAALFNAIGTQRSSRTGQIRRPYEFLYELFAQYLGTGQITLNPLPKSKEYGRKAWGRSTQSLRMTPGAEEESKYTTETLAHDMEIMFNDVLSELVGKVLVM